MARERRKREKKGKNPNHLGLGHLLIWKSCDVSAGWVNLIMLNYLSLYASNTLGISVGLIGTLLLVSRIIDGITDLFAGWLVDNTHTRLGKGRPYDLAIIGMTLCSILIYSCDPEWSLVFKCGWIVCLYTLTFSIFNTLRASATAPYMFRHFHNNRELITKVTSYGGIVTIAGSMVVSIIFPILVNHYASTASGWTLIVAMVMLPATAIGVLRFIFCKEDPSIDENSKQERVSFKEILMLFRRNKYVWIYAGIMLGYNIITNLSVGSYFFTYVIGNLSLAGMTSVFSIVLLPLMLIFPVIMKKFGSMGRMLTCFCFIGIAGYAICFISGSFLPGVLLGYLMGNFATLPLAYYGPLFIMDICTYNEMLGMPRMDSSSNILASFGMKFGAALGSWLTGIILTIGGYQSGTEGLAVTQPASAIMAIRIDFSIIPLLLLIFIAILSMHFSKLEVKIAENEEKEKAEKEVKAESGGQD